MRRHVSFALLAALLAAAAAGPGLCADDAQSLWRENRRLEAEAALAATPKPYFVLDLERGRIMLKARGMAMLEVPVVESGVWGKRMVVGPTAIERRDALARPEIKPGEEKTQETLDAQILELSDMPAAYHLRLAGDVDVDIRAPAEGRFAGLRQGLETWRWRLTRPLVTLRQRRERRESTTVYLVLKAEDARRVYWSFFEGLDGILVPPR